MALGGRWWRWPRIGGGRSACSRRLEVPLEHGNAVTTADRHGGGEACKFGDRLKAGAGIAGWGAGGTIGCPSGQKHRAGKRAVWGEQARWKGGGIAAPTASCGHLKHWRSLDKLSDIVLRLAPPSNSHPNWHGAHALRHQAAQAGRGWYGTRQPRQWSRGLRQQGAGNAAAAPCALLPPWHGAERPSICVLAGRPHTGGSFMTQPLAGWWRAGGGAARPPPQPSASTAPVAPAAPAPSTPARRRGLLQQHLGAVPRG